MPCCSCCWGRAWHVVQAVYEEDLIHRQPGDASTISSMEQGFAPATSWVAEEVDGNSNADLSGEVSLTPHAALENIEGKLSSAFG